MKVRLLPKAPFVKRTYIIYRECCKLKKTIFLLFLLTSLIINSIVAVAAIEQPVSFLQYDEEWNSKPYTITNNPTQTIGSSGCGPTTAAMVLNYYVDDSITPIDTSKFAINNNHRTINDGTAWSYYKDIANEYDLDFKQTSSSKDALQWMNSKSDPLIVCSMGPGLWTSQGHYILLWDIENDIAYINDPYSEELIRNQNSFDLVASQCVQYFCFNKTEIPIVNEIYFNPLQIYLKENFSSLIKINSLLHT